VLLFPNSKFVVTRTELTAPSTPLGTYYVVEMQQIKEAENYIF